MSQQKVIESSLKSPPQPLNFTRMRNEGDMYKRNKENIF